jgi:hypothetical protein
MKIKKLTKEGHTFVLWNEGYMFSPNQLVMVDLHNGGKQIPGVITSLKFSERDGGPTPLADVTIFPWWKNGSNSGGMKIELVPHRYCEPMTDQNVIKSFSSWEETDVSSLFYIDNEDLVFPFKKELNNG